MADWDQISSRGNVEDRRGYGPVIGGLGIGGIVVAIALNMLLGGNIGDLLVGTLEQVPAQQQNNDNSEFAGKDSYEVFASTVLGSNNDAWRAQFSKLNRDYTEPKLVLFRTATNSACGGASSDVGPHYCPLDKTIYLDETFFDELTRRFGGNSGDVAQAYVISHEVGHHAQNLLGTLDSQDGSNESSVKVELQADCFAGIWANSVKDKNVFQAGEINEAIDAAAAVGDDRIQKTTTGRVNPETWTHGSSEQRVKWFETGYNTGSVSACDTFK